MADTALEIIQGALRSLGVLHIGGTASTAQNTEGLAVLNLMLDQFRNEKLMAPWIVQESFDLTAEDAEYTIGAGADFNTTRPIAFEDSCFVRVNSVDYPITLINEAQYNSLPDKNVLGSFPQVLYYNPVYPHGVIKMWPLPGSGNTLFLSSLKQLDSIPGTGTTVSVPPGYTLMYVSNLAVTWAPRFGISPQPFLVRTANQTKRSLRQRNARIGVLGVDIAVNSRFPNSGYVYGDIT